MARKILIDGGAHCGCTRRMFRKLHDKSRQFEIFSFEPDKVLNKYCSCLINKALWTENTIRDFNKFEERGGGTLDKAKADNLQKQEVYKNIRQIISVECIDIDEWIKSQFDPQDFIILKLDVEGAEYQILPHMIQNGSIKYINKILIEWHNIRCNRPKTEDEAIKKHLRGIPIEKWDAMKLGYCFIRGAIKWNDL